MRLRRGIFVAGILVVAAVLGLFLRVDVRDIDRCARSGRLFLEREGGGDYGFDSRLIELNLASKKTRKVLRLDIEPNADIATHRRHYSFSRDGRVFAYVEEDDDYSDDTDEPVRRVLFVTDFRSGEVLLKRDFGSFAISAVSVSPDGGRIALVGRSSAGASGGRDRLDLLDVETGKFLMTGWPVCNGMRFTPSWSPSGDRIALRDKWGNAAVLDWRHGKSRSLRCAAGNPIWSPDGRSLVIGDECVYDWADGCSSRLRLPNDDCEVLGWSPDSRGILYSRPDFFASDTRLCVYVLSSRRSFGLPAEESRDRDEPVLWLP